MRTNAEMDKRQRLLWWRTWTLRFLPLPLFAGLIILSAVWLFGLTKSSDAYKIAVARAKAHPVVEQTLGTPIEEGWFAQGSIEITGPSGKANLSIPLSGPLGEGTLYVVATKSAGQWTFSTLFLTVDSTGQRIDLLVRFEDGKKAVKGGD